MACLDTCSTEGHQRPLHYLYGVFRRSRQSSTLRSVMACTMSSRCLNRAVRPCLRHTRIVRGAAWVCLMKTSSHKSDSVIMECHSRYGMSVLAHIDTSKGARRALESSARTGTEQALEGKPRLAGH